MDTKQQFLDLLEPLHDRLNRFARALSRDREDARDLVAETLLAAYTGFDRLEDPKAFLSYLFTTARRIAARRRIRQARFDRANDGHLGELRSAHAPPDATVDVDALYRALDQLPAPQRDAVVLFEIAGLSLEEVREIQGGTLSGVKARVRRGRIRLAALLGASNETENESQSGDASDRRRNVANATERKER